ncbi:O-antigen ligase family protein [Hymenobacter ginsengisoli]
MKLAKNLTFSYVALFSEARTRVLSVLWSSVIIIGIFSSDFVRVLPSIGVGGLFVWSLLYAIANKSRLYYLNNKYLLTIGFVYLLHLIWGVTNSSLNNSELWRDLLLQLPLLVLPIAFCLLPAMSKRDSNSLWLLLMICCLISAGRATITYLQHYEEINQLYIQSQVMPTVPDHIRFSLLVSIAVIAGAVVASDANAPVILRRAMLAGTIILFMFQHLLAVRSGLATMYAAGILWLVWQRHRWKMMLSVATLGGILALISILLFPTLRNKVINTRSDVGRIEIVDAANNYSITARVYSYKIAWNLIRKHPIIGVSKVRMNEEIARQYKLQYPAIKVVHYLMPHNQFIYNLLAYGWIGLFIFLLSFYYPLLFAWRSQNVLMILLYVIVSISFLVEYTLETHVGILTGIFFLMIAAEPIGLRPSVQQPVPPNR